MTPSPPKKAKFYPQEILQFRNTIEGAKMWSVSLDKTMLTYFKLAPNCRFDRHSHFSEQITLVLSGQLYFEAGAGTICVREGEVMAIPSDVFHAVYTKNRPAVAVDAWSPVREIFGPLNKKSLEIEKLLAGAPGMKP